MIQISDLRSRLKKVLARHDVQLAIVAGVSAALGLVGGIFYERHRAKKHPSNREEV